MVKRILVALDPDLDTSTLIQYATGIAARHHAKVSGITVIDTRQAAATVGAIEPSCMEKLAAEPTNEEVRRSAEQIVHDFREIADKAGVPHEEYIEEGVPSRVILNAAKYHDLLIIGREPNYVTAHPYLKTNTLVCVVKRCMIPVFIPYQSYHRIVRVILAFDGSEASVHTMHRFAQMQPFGNEVEVEIVHVRRGAGKEYRNESEKLLNQAASYMKAYGFNMVHEASLRQGTPHVRLTGHADLIGADMIAAGVHSMTSVMRLIFGSTTRVLLRECAIPLFLSH